MSAKSTARTAAPVASTRHRILVVDDHPVLRHGIVQLIGMESDLEVVGEAESAEQALHVLSATPADLAVVDLSLTGVSGIELLKSIRLRHPATRSLVVSMHDELLYAERSLRAGARGYVMKQEAPKRIISAIREVMAGMIVLSEAMRLRLLERFVDAPRETGHTASRDPSASPLQLLSDRELEVFRLIGQGLKKSEIAQQLKRSVNTVEAHRASIKRKLNLKSAAELARLAFRTQQESE